jgi:hypothetical protein
MASASSLLGSSPHAIPAEVAAFHANQLVSAYQEEIFLLSKNSPFYGDLQSRAERQHASPNQCTRRIS